MKFVSTRVQLESLQIESRVTPDLGRRKPPNPPKASKCEGCKDFTKQGSTGYTIRKTCLDCGHSPTEERQEEPTYPVDVISAHIRMLIIGDPVRPRIMCIANMLHIYIDEAPVNVFKERVSIAKKVETIQVNKVPVVESIVDEESQILTPGQLVNMLPQFAQLDSSAAESEAITRSRLHELLHQSIDDILEKDSFCVVGEEGQSDPEIRQAAS